MPARIATNDVEMRTLIQQAKIFVDANRRRPPLVRMTTAMDIMEGLANALTAKLDAKDAPGGKVD